MKTTLFNRQNIYNKKNRKGAIHLMKRTPESFIEDVQYAVGDEYTFIDTYVNEKTRLTVRHNKCGRVYSVAPRYFLTKGNRCMSCARIAQGKRQRMTPEMFFTRCEEANPNVKHVGLFPTFGRNVY